MKRIKLFIIIVLVSAIPLMAAQTRKKKIPVKPEAAKAEPAKPEPPLDPRLTIPPRGKFEHENEIETDYDKFKNVSTLKVRTYLIKPHPKAEYPNLQPSLWLLSGFEYQGQELKERVRSIALGFIHKQALLSEQDRIFGNHENLDIIADDDRFNLTVDVIERTGNLAGYFETVLTMIPIDTFLKIANAKTIEMRLTRLPIFGIPSPFEFKLDHAQIETLRDMASRTVPEVKAEK